MSVKVIDLNEEVARGSLNSNTVRVEDKEEPPTLEQTEEATEEQQPTEIINEIVEEPKEEPKQEVKPKAKPKASDTVKCDKCDKSMSYKNFRYSHNCDPKPVKKQANPKPKAKPKAVPKPPPDVYYSESDYDEEPERPLIQKKK